MKMNNCNKEKKRGLKYGPSEKIKKIMKHVQKKIKESKKQEIPFHEFQWGMEIIPDWYDLTIALGEVINAGLLKVKNISRGKEVHFDDRYVYIKTTDSKDKGETRDEKSTCFV